VAGQFSSDGSYAMWRRSSVSDRHHHLVNGAWHFTTSSRRQLQLHDYIHTSSRRSIRLAPVRLDRMDRIRGLGWGRFSRSRSDACDTPQAENERERDQTRPDQTRSLHTSPHPHTLRPRTPLPRTPGNYRGTGRTATHGRPTHPTPPFFSFSLVSFPFSVTVSARRVASTQTQVIS
jgi:hypothetical protein